MIVVRTIAELRAATTALRRRGAGLALVPTMGALHEGHRALVEAAVASGAAVAVSIFVNPLQFAVDEDFSRYPRDEAGDLALLREAGCDLVWMPDVSAMYPPGDVTVVDVAGPPAERWEADHRAGHFRGMATVVTKLFAQMRPDAAFFGEKDWQQLQVVKRFVADLHMPLGIVGVPTVRDADGLALSSRNRFLTPAERQIAPLIHSTLRDTATALAAGTAASEAPATASRRLGNAGFVVDYLALVDASSLAPLEATQPNARLITAARLGNVRLIDNIQASM